MTSTGTFRHAIVDKNVFTTCKTATITKFIEPFFMGALRIQSGNKWRRLLQDIQYSTGDPSIFEKRCGEGSREEVWVGIRFQEYDKIECLGESLRKEVDC